MRLDENQYLKIEASTSPNKVKTIHPLPLLTVEGNGRGGGDLGQPPSWVGSWSRDVISVEEGVPEGFEQLLIREGQ